MAVDAQAQGPKPVTQPPLPFTPPDTSSLERTAYLVGNPIAHSKSPSMHRAVYSAVNRNWGQTLAETADLTGFVEFLRNDTKALGSGVTMPHKVAVIPLLDELAAEGEAIGAVNTIFFKTGENGQRVFCGTNTDCIGIRDAFLNNVAGSSYRGKPGVVIGGGGTCRAAVYALQRFLGCSAVYIINRDPAEVEMVLKECRQHGTGQNLIHVSSVAQAQQLEPPGIIVSAVPDFPPVTDGEKAVRQILSTFMQAQKEKGPLLEMCYHPSPDTQITKLATACGWQVIPGIEAMIGQGLAQISLWTGLEIDEPLREVARRVVRGQA